MEGIGWKRCGCKVEGRGAIVVYIYRVFQTRSLKVQISLQVNSRRSNPATTHSI